MHADAVACLRCPICRGPLALSARAVILATGGTARAATALLRAAGADVVGFAALIELAALAGRAVLDPLPVVSLRTY